MPNPFIPPTVITNFRLNNKSVAIDSDIVLVCRLGRVGVVGPARLRVPVFTAVACASSNCDRSLAHAFGLLAFVASAPGQAGFRFDPVSDDAFHALPARDCPHREHFADTPRVRRAAICRGSI